MNDTVLEKLHEFHVQLEQEGFLLAYSGSMDPRALEEMGDALKLKLLDAEVRRSKAMQVFTVFVESTQNIMRYSFRRDSLGEREVGSGSVLILRRQRFYYIQSGNIVSGDQVRKLERNLNHLSSLNLDERRQYYLEKLNECDLDKEEPGSGLGLVMMVLPARDISWKFSRMDAENDKYFYTLQVRIPEMEGG